MNRAMVFLVINDARLTYRCLRTIKQELIELISSSVKKPSKGLKPNFNVREPYSVYTLYYGVRKNLLTLSPK